jgi:hypothetical protein
LERYLEMRPQDNAVRLNLASSLLLQGKLEEGRALLELAGDPRRQARQLRWRFRGNSILRLQRLPALLATLLLSALALGGLALALMPQELREASGGVVQRPYGGFREGDFKRAETQNTVIFYHDRVDISSFADLVESALSYDLKFLGMDSAFFSGHKIHVFLCANQKEYMARSPSSLSWEAGAAIPSRNEFYIYPHPIDNLDGMLLETVAHELCHICYYQLIPDIGQDSWLNEGFARFQGFNYLCQRYGYPPSAWVKEKLFDEVAKKPLPFQLFLHESPRDLPDVNDVGQFYTQGHSMVFVLIQYYGKDAFMKYLRNVSRTRDLDQSFAGAYDTILKLDDLRAIWNLFMK